MIPRAIINDDFISKWHPLYDEKGIGEDYEEYSIIKQKVSNEIACGLITKQTFIDILNWKAPRLKGIVKLADYENYSIGIKKALEAPESQKLAILDDLYGIGVPVASTILHFIYPLSFPIMDVRVAEVLYYSGYIKAKSRTQRNYILFRKVILDIEKQSRYTICEIDRALFSYHKIKTTMNQYEKIGLLFQKNE